MLLTAAGKAIDMREQDRAAAGEVRARNEMLNRHNAEQDALAASSRESLGALLTQINPPQSALATAQARRNDVAQSAITERTPGDILAASNAPKVVQADAAKQMREAMASSREKAAQNAKMAGFGDQVFEQQLNTNTAGNSINLNNGFSNVSAALLPQYQQLYALEKYKQPSGIGSLLMSLGNAAGTVSGGGGFGGGAPGGGDPWAGLRNAPKGM